MLCSYLKFLNCFPLFLGKIMSVACYLRLYHTLAMANISSFRFCHLSQVYIQFSIHPELLPFSLTHCDISYVCIWYFPLYFSSLKTLMKVYFSQEAISDLPFMSVLRYSEFCAFCSQSVVNCWFIYSFSLLDCDLLEDRAIVFHKQMVNKYVDQLEFQPLTIQDFYR